VVGEPAEHNVIKDASWPLQSFSGEFRYNLMINSGHDFIRGSDTNANFHHNLLVHAQTTNSQFDAAFLMYESEQNVIFDHNTIDAGGAVAGFDAPAIVLGAPTVSMASLRNNVFTGFSMTNTLFPTPSLISASTSEATVSAPRVALADYNAWDNPLATGDADYMPGIVGGTVGAHDLTGDPMFVGPVPQAPYQIDEGMVWLRQYGTSQVLSYYRALYTPMNGSPLIDAGDPSEGSGNDIGAIGAGASDPNDKFGLVLTP
jgi:hypothetical protein